VSFKFKTPSKEVYGKREMKEKKEKEQKRRIEEWRKK